jgi:MoxR-like ATPase
VTDRENRQDLPGDVSQTLALLTGGDYIAGRDLATVVYLALSMGRPLLLEGEAGVGKTEIAKVLAATLGRDLIRLQCFEGLDLASAAYEWNYPRQKARPTILARVFTSVSSSPRDRCSVRWNNTPAGHRCC